MKYKISKIDRTHSLLKLMEKRRVKGRMQWVCIGILTGRKNSREVLGRLNAR